MGQEQEGRGGARGGMGQEGGVGAGKKGWGRRRGGAGGRGRSRRGGVGQEGWGNRAYNKHKCIINYPHCVQNRTQKVLQQVWSNLVPLTVLTALTKDTISVSSACCILVVPFSSQLDTECTSLEWEREERRKK